MILFFSLFSCHSKSLFDIEQYENGVLYPVFEQANSAWAGVALLDYNNDGWLDIFFTNGLSQPDALYRNMGDNTFVDVTNEAGLFSLEQHGGVAAADLDNDGDQDLVVAKECSLGTLSAEGLGIGDGGILIYWNENGVFHKQNLTHVELLRPYGVCPVGFTLYDINKDGLLDIDVSNGLDLDQIYPWIYRKEVREAIDIVLLNDSAHDFASEWPLEEMPVEDIVTDEIPFQFVTFTTTYVDFNSDGISERVAGRGGSNIAIYVQESEGSHRYIPTLSGQAEGLWMGLATADYDGDQDFDIYATNQGLSPLILGYDNIPTPRPNQNQEDIQNVVYPFHTIFSLDTDLISPQKNWDFEANGILAGDYFTGILDAQGNNKYPQWIAPDNLERLGWGWAAVAADVNSDGWMDVVFNGNNCSPPMCIIHTEEKGASPGGVLINNQGERFTESAQEWNLKNIQNDGLYPDGRGIAVGDLNNDGYIDFVFANRGYNPSQSGPLEQIYGVPNIFISRPRKEHWLQIDLLGTTSNRDGIGSIITISTDSSQMKYLFEPGGNTCASNERLFTVGVGDKTQVNIHVRFPSGIEHTLTNIQTNQRIIIEEE